MATCIMHIGSIYSSIPENIDQSLPYYLRALEISELINHTDGVGLVSFNLGDFYFQKEAYDSALFYFEKSLEDQALINVAESLNIIAEYMLFEESFHPLLDPKENLWKLLKKLMPSLKWLKYILDWQKLIKNKVISNLPLIISKRLKS